MNEIPCRVNFWLEWTATIITLIGCTLNAYNIVPYNIWVSDFSAFLFTMWSIRIRRWSLVLVNGGILIIYSAGAVHHFITTTYEEKPQTVHSLIQKVEQ